MTNARFTELQNTPTDFDAKYGQPTLANMIRKFFSRPLKIS